MKVRIVVDYQTAGDMNELQRMINVINYHLHTPYLRNLALLEDFDTDNLVIINYIEPILIHYLVNCIYIEKHKHYIVIKVY